MDGPVSVEYGFDKNDETVYFGDRTLAYDQPYETATLAIAKLKKNKEQTIKAHIKSTVKNGRILYSINESMVIFKDKEGSSLCFTATFDDIIDTFCLTSDDSCLFILLRNGSFHIFKHSGNQYSYVSTINIIKNLQTGKLFIDCFIESHSPTNIQVLTVSTSGSIFRITCPHENVYSTSPEEIVSNVGTTTEEIFNSRSRVDIVALDYPLILLSGPELTIFNLETQDVINGEAPNLKKIFPASLMFLGLLEDGNLVWICPHSLLLFPVHDQPLYADLLVVTDSPKCVAQIVTVSDTDENGKRLLAVLQPDLTVKYSIKLTTDVCLVCSESGKDDVHYISILETEGLTDELRFQYAYETNMEQWLSKLIHRRMFDEANQFVLSHGLDVNIVHKEKAKLILDKQICTSQDVNELFSILAILEDDVFKVDCCIKLATLCVDANDVLKLLSHGSNMNKGKITNKIVRKMESECRKLFSRFSVFMSLHQYKMTEWCRFSTCDLAEEVKLALKDGEIWKASIIYNRMDSTTIDSLDERCIVEIMSILRKIPISTYVHSFLPTFIPKTLKLFPTTVPVFARWIYLSTFQLEHENPAEFPANGLEFVAFTFRFIEINKRCNMFNQQCVSYKKLIGKLRKLRIALEDLSILKTKYNVKIPLTKYLQNPRTVIRTMLNLEVNPSTYEKLLVNFIPDFVLRHDLALEDIYLTEITNMLEYDENYWINFVVPILSHITTIEVHLIVVQRILDVAYVPWCDTVRELAMKCLKYAHPLVEIIQKYIEKEPVLTVLSKQEYGFEYKTMEDVDDLTFLVKRMIYCDPPTLIQDAYHMCILPGYKTEVTRQLFQHFLEEGKFETSLSILDNSSNEDAWKCLESTILRAQLEVNNGKLGTCADKYMDVIDCILDKYKHYCKDEIQVADASHTVNTLKNVYYLNTTYDVKLSAHAISRKQSKEEAALEISTKLEEDWENGTMDVDSAFKKFERLSDCLLLDREDLLIRFSEQILKSKYDFMCKVGEELYDNSDDVKYLCVAAVCLLYYLGTTNVNLDDISLFETSMTFISSESVSSNDIFIRGLQLADNLTIKAICVASSYELSACLEIRRWINLLFLLRHGYPSLTVFHSIRDAFQMFTSYIGQFNNPNTRFITHFNSNDITSQDAMLQYIGNFPKVFNSLMLDGQQLLGYKLLTTLQNGLLNVNGDHSKLVGRINDITKTHCVPQLIQSVINSNDINCDLLLNLLYWRTPQEIQDYIIQALQKYKRQPIKLYCLASAGLHIFNYHELYKMSALCKIQMQKVVWWQKMKNGGLKYDEFFKSPPGHGLEMLLTTNCLNLNQLKEYCIDFDLNLKHYQMMFLMKLLLNWKPEYDVEVDTDGKRTLLMKAKQKNDLFRSCLEVINVINNEREVYDILIDSVWDKVNFYYYEVFSCIIIALWNYSNPVRENTVKNKVSVLLFLENYRRSNKPSDIEMESWFNLFPRTKNLDPLSEFRLPFTSSLTNKNIWNVIRSEINLKNYTNWFEWNGIFSYLNIDDICSYLVKELVSRNDFENIKPGDWLHPKLGELFNDIDKCLQCMESLERKTSAAYYLLSHVPEGADQVDIAKITYRYALEYKEVESSSTDFTNSFTKVEKKYQRCLSMQILHKYQLAAVKYIELILNFDELILALYRDERIIKRGEPDCLGCPDINKAVDLLAEVYGRNVTNFRHNLVQNWLMGIDIINSNFSTTTHALDFQFGDNEIDEDNLKIITYMCKNEDLDCMQASLWESAQSDNNKYTTNYKVRALRCLLAITDINSIETVTKRTYKEFLSYIDDMTYASILEYMKLSSEYTFKIDDKRSVIKMLARSETPNNIKAIMKICFIFGMYNERIWKFIIKAAMKFEMFEELKKSLEFLENGMSEYSDFYVNGWQQVIDYYVDKKLCSKDPGNVFMNLVDFILMIQSCPVLFLLNMESCVQKFVKTGWNQFAAVLLQYVSSDKRPKYMKEILQKEDIMNVVDYLERFGITGISLVRNLLTHNDTTLEN